MVGGAGVVPGAMVLAVAVAGVFLQAGLPGFGGGWVMIPLLQDQVVGLG